MCLSWGRGCIPGPGTLEITQAIFYFLEFSFICVMAEEQKSNPDQTVAADAEKVEVEPEKPKDPTEEEVQALLKKLGVTAKRSTWDLHEKAVGTESNCKTLGFAVQQADHLKELFMYSTSVQETFGLGVSVGLVLFTHPLITFFASFHHFFTLHRE